MCFAPRSSFSRPAATPSYQPAPAPPPAAAPISTATILLEPASVRRRRGLKGKGKRGRSSLRIRRDRSATNVASIGSGVNAP